MGTSHVLILGNRSEKMEGVFAWDEIDRLKDEVVSDGDTMMLVPPGPQEIRAIKHKAFSRNRRGVIP